MDKEVVVSDLELIALQLSKLAVKMSTVYLRPKVRIKAKAA